MRGSLASAAAPLWEALLLSATNLFLFCVCAGRLSSVMWFCLLCALLQKGAGGLRRTRELVGDKKSPNCIFLSFYSTY